MKVWCTSSALILAALMMLAECPTAQAAEESSEAVIDAEHTEVHSGDVPNPLVFDPDLAIFTGIVFLLLMAVLGKYAWPSITAALAEREQNIAGNIEAAAAKHEEAKKLLAEHEQQLASTAGEVREMLEEARRDAEHTKNRIVAEARDVADGERNRTLREIDQAKNAAMQSLAVTSANLAVDLAHKVVRDKLTSEQQSQIVREAIGKLATTEPSEN